MKLKPKHIAAFLTGFGMFAVVIITRNEPLFVLFLVVVGYLTFRAMYDSTP